ncbi:MAG: hypothetical protein LLF83_10765, partial [Methanobacterium sp.]|nr:hypothetical protein [Methanobacterium sp.]
LSLVTFTYIAAVRDLDEKVRSSMVIAGEDFIVSTVQFIVGLGIFLGVNLIFSHFINEADWSNLNLIPIFILEIIQVIGIYEVATALSKFLKGIIEVYKTFKTRSQLYRIYKMLIK